MILHKIHVALWVSIIMITLNNSINAVMPVTVKKAEKASKTTKSSTLTEPKKTGKFALITAIVLGSAGCIARQIAKNNAQPVTPHGFPQPSGTTQSSTTPQSNRMCARCSLKEVHPGSQFCGTTCRDADRPCAHCNTNPRQTGYIYCSKTCGQQASAQQGVFPSAQKQPNYSPSHFQFGTPPGSKTPSKHPQQSQTLFPCMNCNKLFDAKTIPHTDNWCCSVACSIAKGRPCSLKKF